MTGTPASPVDVVQAFNAATKRMDYDTALVHVAAGNAAFMERLDRHRVAQGWFELPVTGVYEVRDGRIVYWRDCFDKQTVVGGMSRPMGSSR